MRKHWLQITLLCLLVTSLPAWSQANQNNFPGTGGGGGAVSSVFGRTGAVVATSGDYAVGQVTGAAPLLSPTFTGTVTMPDGSIWNGSGIGNSSFFPIDVNTGSDTSGVNYQIFAPGHPFMTQFANTATKTAQFNAEILPSPGNPCNLSSSTLTTASMLAGASGGSVNGICVDDNNVWVVKSGTSTPISGNPIQVNGGAAIAAPVNLQNSSTNTVGLTCTPVNTSGSNVTPCEVGGTYTGSLPASSAHNLAVPMNCPDSSGSGTVQVCNTNPTFTPSGGIGGPNDAIWYTTTTANTSAGLTVNVNSLGAKSVAIPGASGWTTTLTAGIIPANKPIEMIYDGTNWDVVQTGTAAAGGSGYTASSTVGNGGIWSDGGTSVIRYNNAVNATPVIGTMYFQQLNLSYTQPVGHFTFDSSNTSAVAEVMVVCLYDSTATTLLTSGSANQPAVAGAYSVPVTPINFGPGTFYVAYEPTGTTAGGLANYTNGTNGTQIIINKQGNREGTSANVATGTTCPASLGTLTGVTNTASSAAIWLEP